MKSNSHEKHQCAHGLCAPVDVMVAYTVAISVCFAVQSGQASIQKVGKEQARLSSECSFCHSLCKHASADSCSAVYVIGTNTGLNTQQLKGVCA